MGTLRAFEDESSFSLLKNDNDESRDIVEDMQRHTRSGYHMERKNTLGPTEMVPLSARTSNIFQMPDTGNTNAPKVSFSNSLIHDFYRAAELLKKSKMKC